MASTRDVRVSVNGAELAAATHGDGEPFLLISTALSAGHLVPLAHELAQLGRFRFLTYDRRGYGSSTSPAGPGSIRRDAEDAIAVLNAMGVSDAHVLGDSFSAAIALELALLQPGRVRSLTLVEPPPSMVEGADGFRALARGLAEDALRAGASAALESFMSGLVGLEWRDFYDRVVPGTSGNIERDAAAFFRIDIPALAGWEVDPSRAAHIQVPVLYIAGGASGPIFKMVRPGMSELLPGARVAVIPEAGHEVSFTHPQSVAGAVAEFLASVK